jgi:hypothetical protein
MHNPPKRSHACSIARGVPFGGFWGMPGKAVFSWGNSALRKAWSREKRKVFQHCPLPVPFAKCWLPLGVTSCYLSTLTCVPFIAPRYIKTFSALISRSPGRNTVMPRLDSVAGNAGNACHPRAGPWIRKVLISGNPEVEKQVKTLYCIMPHLGSHP